MKTVYINSIEEYIRLVMSIEPHISEMLLEKNEIVYRGLSSDAYELVPSIVSREFEHWVNQLSTFENEIISRAQEKIPDFLNSDMLPVAKLAKLQHYGLPTRMMDVTSNPLVALFFACKTTHNQTSENGEVVVFSTNCLPSSNPFVNIIADSYRLIGNHNTWISTYYYRAMQQDYSISLIYPEWQKNFMKKRSCSLAEFKRNVSATYLVDSYEYSVRQKNQQGKYILFPNRISEEPHEEPLVMNHIEGISKEDNRILKRIIIQKDNKAKLLKQLAKLGINEAFLFADNTNIVMKNIKKQMEEYFES